MSIASANLGPLMDRERLMNKAYFGGALKPLNSYLEGDPSLSLAGDRRRLRRKGCRHLFALGFMLVVVLSAGAPLFGIGVSISGQSRSDVLKIGYIETAFYDLRLKDAQVALEMWGSSLINRKESPLSKVDALIIPSFALLQNAVSKDELDVVILGSVDYLMLKDRNLIEPVMAPNSRNDCLQNYLILVRKDRGINELAQLKNSRLLLALGGEGELPRIWLDTLLLKEGLGKSPLFFKETKAVEKASQAVLPVFFGQADACLATARSFTRSES